MPAPHRRNKGDSLARHIDTNAGARKIANDRDNLVAQRTRKDAKWEEAASNLERATGSTLEQRAAQTLSDFERGLNLDRFDRAVKKGKAKPPPPLAKVNPRVPRYYLGACLDCDLEMWEHRPRPRVPLCRTCRGRRAS